MAKIDCKLLQDECNYKRIDELTKDEVVDAIGLSEYLTCYNCFIERDSDRMKASDPIPSNYKREFT